MKSVIKPWNDGGSLSVSYDGSGNGSAAISSDVNEGIDREQSITVSTAYGDNPKSVDVNVKQYGLREVFTGYDEIFITADGGTFNSIKDEL